MARVDRNLLRLGAWELSRSQEVPAKVAINEAWDENYGEGGVPGGANVAFTVPPSPSTTSGPGPW